MATPSRQGLAAGSVSAPEGAVEVSPLRPGEEGSWDQFVKATPSATFFHSSTWAKVVEREFGRTSCGLVARRTGRISGVFPISRVRSRLFGDWLVSSPWRYMAAFARTIGIPMPAAGGGRLGHRLGVKYLEMRNRTEPFRLARQGPVCHVHAGSDARDRKNCCGLPRDTRYAVRKSQKAGLEWTEDLSHEEFYEIYAQSVHRLGTPVFSRALFAACEASFPDSAGFSEFVRGRRRLPASSASISGIRCCRITAGRWRSTTRILPTTSCTGV